MPELYLLTLLLSAVCGSCNNSGNRESGKGADKTIIDENLPYDFRTPDSIWEMPHKLQEISGIADIGNNLVAAIEDEHGIIYIYDLVKRDIVSEIKFDKGGDYEDLAVNGTTAYVLRTDGKLFEVKDYLGNMETVKYELKGIKRKNDPEGLFYDTSQARFLVACKEFAGNDEPGNIKGVYSYKPGDYEGGSMLFRIDNDEVRKISGKNTDFKPSAIAIHPVTGNYILISSHSKEMIEVSVNGKLLNVWKLKDKLFKQPEGIFFKSNGDVFISNEGKGGTGNILLFKYRK